MKPDFGSDKIGTTFVKGGFGPLTDNDASFYGASATALCANIPDRHGTRFFVVVDRTREGELRIEAFTGKGTCFVLNTTTDEWK